MELAFVCPHGAVSVSDVARTPRVSAKYLEHNTAAPRLARIVQSIRGLSGGYELVRPPFEIRLLDVYEIPEGPRPPVACVDAAESCPMSPIRATRDTRAEFKAAIRAVPAHKTPEDLAGGRLQKAASAMPS